MNQKNSATLKYPVVRNLPVARFYYQGHHTHPVRRTVIVTELTAKLIKGYEVREGSTTRTLANAPVKSFSRDKIAMISQCGKRLRKRAPKQNHENSTLTRDGLLNILTNGF
jgi:hypothetical protein